MPQFNNGQQALIDAPLDQKVVGVAGAGTGKTTTILGRTQRILREYESGRMVMITFTRAAANDMQVRLAGQISPDDAKRVTVGTFHSIIGSLIRDHAEEVGLSSTFSVIDENSTKTMVKAVVENNSALSDWVYNLELAKKEYQNEGPLSPSQKKKFKVTDSAYSKLAGYISVMVNSAQPLELQTGDFSERSRLRMFKLFELSQAEEAFEDEILEYIYRIFLGTLSEGKRTNTVTYDHILFIGYLMLKSGMLDQYCDSLVHLIVDEYQDTNALQDYFVRYVGGQERPTTIDGQEVLRLPKDKHPHLTLVGDVDQSIYEFRGGEARLLEQHAAEAIVVNLNINYRSFQPTLDLANHLIAHNETGASIRKDLVAAKDIADGGFDGNAILDSFVDSKESDKIVERIKFLHKLKDVDYSDIAILVRGRMALPSISQKLASADIPVNNTTKLSDFMTSEVMIDALNFIKVLTNPQDVYAFMAIINKPKRSIGEKAIKKIQTEAAKVGMSVIEFLMSDNAEVLTPSLRSHAAEFVDVYKHIIDPANKNDDLTTMIAYIFENTGYKAWKNGLAKKDKEKFNSNYQTLLGMVQEFVADYSKEHKDYTLYDIANAFTIEMTNSTHEQNTDGVVISTVHSAKGLEWDYVFVVGVEDSVFPMPRPLDELDPEDQESERRLMYVAITRAKKSLWLTHVKYRMTKDTDLTPSPFLNEVGNVPVINN